MHTSEVSHVKTVEEFYKSIREQQEVEKNNNEWWKKYKLIK